MAATNACIPRARADLPRSHGPLAHLMGADTIVRCLDGRSRPYVNLDYAASTPAMVAVWDAVEAFVPWYSSVHRGSGLKSRLSTAAFEDARDIVAEFVGARAEDAVVFVRNTTEPINLLSAALEDLNVAGNPGPPWTLVGPDANRPRVDPGDRTRRGPAQG